MKLNLKDYPKEWRKSAWLLLLALALVTTLLRWRHVLSNPAWLAILAALVVLAVVATRQPRWFRGYHLFSMRLGFAISRILGRVFLSLFFVLILTPMGWLLRLAGKDSLQLKPPASATTYWQTAKESSPLERMF